MDKILFKSHLKTIIIFPNILSKYLLYLHGDTIAVPCQFRLLVLTLFDGIKIQKLVNIFFCWIIDNSFDKCASCNFFFLLHISVYRDRYIKGVC